METVLVIETAKDVWFDDFSISRTPSIVIQETHYDPWGLELTGLGYQNGEVKENKYLYNEKELISDLNLNLYDYGGRYFDPVIGRWTSPDPMASEREWLSPYNYVQNNPLLRIDPDGMLDEYNYNIDSGEFEWISDKGGDKTQYVNIVNNEGDRLGQGSVSGDEVYAYKLKESVVLTNFDADFDDQTYNAKNNFEYSFSEFSLRNELLKSDDVISRYLKSSEKAGKAVPLTYSAEETRYGYTSMRLKMMISSIDQSFDAMPSFYASPKASKFGTTIREAGYISTGLKGNKGVTSLTNQTSWNRFLKANAGNYSGKGWQRRAAAADYYKSNYYKK